ncbi:hypothetical protein ACFXGI_16570 [Streptomyces sp. NPDC059355]|uniref:hypothetical protein n=1 Tax=Streptomyces sp. NPDC059355 TaxID=3346811 RepID=UPI0036CA6851
MRSATAPPALTFPGAAGIALSPVEEAAQVTTMGPASKTTDPDAVAEKRCPAGETDVPTAAACAAVGKRRDEPARARQAPPVSSEEGKRALFVMIMV